MPEISLIAAVAKNNVIGNKGKIPWNIPGEQSRFRELTTGNVVIMGRKTFEEIYKKLGKPLPNRINIIISSSKNYLDISCPTFSSLLQAIEFSKKNYPKKNIFIAGGASLYKESILYADKIYLTEINLTAQGDVFFPDFDKTNFIKTVGKTFLEPVYYSYVTYSKTSKSLSSNRSKE